MSDSTETTEGTTTVDAWLAKKIDGLEAEIKKLVKGNKKRARKLSAMEREVERIAAKADAALAAAEAKEKPEPKEKPWARAAYPEALLKYVNIHGEDKIISVDDDSKWRWVTPKEGEPLILNQWYIPMYEGVPMEVPLTVFEEVQRRKLAK